jgi:hypothetical protein
MGTWGSGPFDNDDAGDWTYQLTPDADQGVVEGALTAAVADGDPDTTTSQAAIAAAEVVAAGLGRPHPSLPEEVAGWVGTRGQGEWRALAPLALRSINRILASSELVDVWTEDGNDGDWSAEMQDLRTRLIE